MNRRNPGTRSRFNRVLIAHNEASVRVRLVSLVFAATMALAACGKGDTSAANTKATATVSGPALPDGRNPSALVTALDSATLAGLQQRTGTWKEADASSTWIAYGNNNTIRVIDERMAVGESSVRRVMHYYSADGQLVSHIETRDQTVQSRDRSPTREFVLMSMEFAGDSVTKSSKSVDGQSKPIERFEIDNARKHAAMLLSDAMLAPATPASSKP